MESNPCVVTEERIEDSSPGTAIEEKVEESIPSLVIQDIISQLSPLFQNTVPPPNPNSDVEDTDTTMLSNKNDLIQDLIPQLSPRGVTGVTLKIQMSPQPLIQDIIPKLSPDIVSEQNDPEATEPEVTCEPEVTTSSKSRKRETRSASPGKLTSYKFKSTTSTDGVSETSASPVIYLNRGSTNNRRKRPAREAPKRGRCSSVDLGWHAIKGPSVPVVEEPIPRPSPESFSARRERGTTGTMMASDVPKKIERPSKKGSKKELAQGGGWRMWKAWE